MARRAEQQEEEDREVEFDELGAMRRIDNLLKKAPDDQTRRRITNWLFDKWGERQEGV